MNHRSSGLQLSKALDGFLQYKAAEGLSPNTLHSYEGHLKLWLDHTGDVEISQVTSQDLRAYLVWLRTDYKPRRLTGDSRPLTPKTIRNVWATLCSFFTWASIEFDLPNPMKAVPAPRFERPLVEPFSKEDIEALLKACKFSREANTTRRDQAIILTLLDTGLRASEFCSLKVSDADLKNGRVYVKHGRSGGAKFGKGRVVFLGKVARRVVWRYLAEREDGEDPDAPLFTGKFDRPMDKNALRLLVGQATRPLLKVVMTGSHRFLTQVRQRGSPLRNVLKYHGLHVLGEQATLHLVTRPTEGILPKEVVHAVVGQSGGHRYCLPAA